jgi:hypothetical protein
MRAQEFLSPANENFADGRKPGRKGVAKRSGVNCKASVISLRKTAKNSTGERQRMAHWCANMKSGRSEQYHDTGRGDRMKLGQLLREFSKIEDRIQKELESRGYKFLGQGVDQMAFLEPSTGLVLKIFGSQCRGDANNLKLSADQRMFKLYAEFCEQNKHNPYLPRFYGWDTFIYDTKLNNGRIKPCLYLQIRTELLKNFDEQWTDFFEEMSSDMIWSNDFQSFNDRLRRSEYGRVNRQWYRNQTNDPQAKQRIENLYRTMRALYEMGERRNWSWDLHGANIMQRGDGTPVITDPWVI